MLSKKISCHNLNFVVLVFLFFSGCNTSVRGVVLEKESKNPIDSVTVSNRDILRNSFPFPVNYTNSNGAFDIKVKSTDSIIYFWKRGYKSLPLLVEGISGVDTIFMIRDEEND